LHVQLFDEIGSAAPQRGGQALDVLAFNQSPDFFYRTSFQRAIPFTILKPLFLVFAILVLLLHQLLLGSERFVFGSRHLLGEGGEIERGEGLWPVLGARTDGGEKDCFGTAAQRVLQDARELAVAVGDEWLLESHRLDTGVESREGGVDADGLLDCPLLAALF
jgi:hypothetical protein